ncbi:DMT family transporter [Chitinophaga sp. sic0106]|uniref:DMT family transporter n=1 Tax=Chitinophaga sp. sic0106 TaxID=2854785 RepID=UPI001C477659|nr:DMT family transporter [Chitinophaga sp. sic0106]MBV7530929.1 DMT family transporter [Chitinophaga sp. sic0106]
MSKKHLFLILLIIGTAFWGIAYSVTKLAIREATPSTFLFYRFVGATLVLALLFRRRISMAAVGTGIRLGLPLVAGTVLVTIGIKHTSASQAAFVLGIVVVLVPLFKLLLFRAAMPFKAWASAFMALVGLFIICIQGEFRVSTGDLYSIGSAVSFSLYLLSVERASATTDVIASIVPMFATCAVVTGCMAIFDHQATWIPVSPGFWACVAYCALFSTAYMYTVSNIAQKYISAEKVAVIYLLEPVFGALAAYVMLDEELSWRLLLGGGLIVVATVVSEMDIRKRAVVYLQKRDK